MQIDWSAVELFCGYADGEIPLSRVWDHPAYGVVREQAELLGTELTRADVERAMAGEENAFGGLEEFADNREDIADLLDHVRAHEATWTAQIAHQLERITSDEDVSDVTCYLGIGSNTGVGTERGAYVNLNEPLFHDRPRQLLYTIIHECSHVLYEREHRSKRKIGPESMETRAGQWRVWNTVCHTEAYATYTPLELRRADGNVGNHSHPISEDYRVLSDEARMTDLVAEYDSFRGTLGEAAVSRETLFTTLFGGSRLPYRVGCAVLDRLEANEGIDAVRNGFYLDPEEFYGTYDWVLDEYRTHS